MLRQFLCFYADGPKWENIPLVSAYPAGYSYWRPFRYRKRWIEDSLLDQMATDDGRGTICSRDTLLCMRFSDHAKVYPIRKVTITHVDYLPGNHSLYFKMGPLVDFSAVESLSGVGMDIPIGDRDRIWDSLFFASDIDCSEVAFVDSPGIQSTRAWSAFADQVADDQRLGINEKAKHAVFFRISHPVRHSSRKEPAPTGRLYDSPQEGTVYGPHLAEGRNYDIVFLHRIPTLIDTNLEAPRIEVTYDQTADNLELGRERDIFDSNYETHSFPVTGRRASARQSELVLIPGNKEYEVDGKMVVHVPELRIRYRVTFNLIHQLFQRWLWLLSLWLVLVGETIASKGIAELGGWDVALDGIFGLLLIIITAKAKEIVGND